MAERKRPTIQLIDLVHLAGQNLRSAVRLLQVEVPQLRVTGTRRVDRVCRFRVFQHLCGCVHSALGQNVHRFGSFITQSNV